MTTSGEQLNNKLKNVPGFIGVYSSDNLPNPALFNYSFIVNYDGEDKPGSHWVGFKSTNGKLKYFDSFGNPPDEDDLILHDKTHFKNWLYERDRKYEFNQFDYQSLNQNTCGEWSAMFIKSPQQLNRARLIPKHVRDAFVKQWFASI